jgi:uncharacterized phiE125 gp8 family phage protein
MVPGLRLLVPPIAEPISLSEAKDHLRIVDTADDAEVLRKLCESRQVAEHECGRQFVTATWKMTLDEFPTESRGEVRLYRPPLMSVTSVKYYDVQGVLRTVSSGDYFVATESEPGRIVPKSGRWPSTQDGRPSAVEIVYVAGYSAVPDDLKAAIKLILARAWERRGDDDGKAGEQDAVPPAAQRIIKGYRNHLL